jgi:hypothetical protein
MPLKRKASASGPSPDETPTKVRKSLADFQPQGGALPQPNGEATRRTTGYDQKAAEKAARWAELVFIVFTKENFKQDPSGPPGHSTTTGPLTNVQLRDAYCTKFSKEVGTEAAMKRYRNDKQKVYDAFPNHPRSISYAPKQGKPQNAKGVACFSANNPATLNAERTVEGDLGRNVQSSWTVAEHETKPWVSILLADSCERFIGACSVDVHALQSSQAYVEFRQHTNVRELWLTGVSRITLQRYIQCISPLRLSKLPKCDFVLQPGRSDPVAAVASCKRIAWGFQATIDLYELATQLRDCHVRNLVLDHWRARLQVNRTYEVGLMEMQLLYDRLETDDPALQLWTRALQDLMPADDSAMDVDLVDSRSSTALLVANAWRHESDEAFHYQYHRCRLSDHKDGMCDHFQNTHTEASYTFDDFNYITRRLLLSEGWEEMDGQVQTAANKLAWDLFNKFSLL